MGISVQHPHSHPLGKSPFSYWEDQKPIYTVHVGENPHIYLWGDIVLINHRNDRKERIIGCSLHLKKRHWLFWDKTITFAEVKESVQRGGATPQHKSINNVELPPVSAPLVLTVEANAPIQVPMITLPEKMKLVLEFQMVGPIRRMRHLLSLISHNPKELMMKNQDKKPNPGITRRVLHSLLAKASQPIKKSEKEKS